MTGLIRKPRPWLLPAAAPALMAGILLGSVTASIWPCVGGLAAALVTFLLSGGKRSIPLLLVAASLGAVLGQPAYHPTLPEEGTYAVTGVVSDEVLLKENGQIRTTLTSVTLNGRPHQASAYWSFYADALPQGLEPGAAVSFSASLYHPGGSQNPGGFDFRTYLLQHGTNIGLYGQTDLVCTPGAFNLQGIIAGIRHGLCGMLTKVMGKEAGGYAGAMLLGVRSGIDQQDREYFNALGVGHLLSVSGFHVGILYGALVFLLKGLRLSKKRRFWPILLLLAFYCVLTGGNAPVIRASLLCLLREYGILKGRQRSSLHLICASAMLQLIISPVQLTSAGFQLSYGALLGICLVTPTLVRLRPLQCRLFPAALWSGLSAAIGAQIGVLLPQLYWYQELPVLGILCNTLLLTLAGGLLTVYWVCLVLMWIPWLGPLLGKGAARLTSLLLTGVRTFGSADWLMLWTRQADLLTALGWVLLILGLCALWRMKASGRLALILTGLLLMTASLLPQSLPGASYIQLSVGDADAAVLTDNRTVTVIDTGEDSTLSTYLHQRRMSIDSLILTHMHKDHAAGVQYLLEDRIPVGTCYVSVDAEQGSVSPEYLALLDKLEARGTRIIRLSRGDVISTGSGSLTVLWPEKDRPRAWKDANDGSLCMLLRLEGVTLLATGDLCGEYERYAAAKADILKVAHHGSYNSSSAAFLAVVAPENLLLSCGKASREEGFGPRVTSGRLYSTYSQGALTVRFTGSGRYTIEPWLKQE